MSTQAQLSGNQPTDTAASQMGDLFITSKIIENHAIMYFKGRLEFYSHRLVRDAFREALTNTNIKHLTIDLAKVEYISSLGIGMLLVVKDMATAAGIKLGLANPMAHVGEILNIAHIGKLIPITGGGKVH